MSFVSKIKGVGDSRRAWYCLFVTCVLVTGAYAYVFLYLVSNIDGHNAAWSAGGALASGGLAWVCWTIYEDTPPRVLDGPLARTDADWGPLSPDLLAEFDAAFRESEKIIR